MITIHPLEKLAILQCVDYECATFVGSSINFLKISPACREFYVPTSFEVVAVVAVFMQKNGVDLFISLLHRNIYAKFPEFYV